MTGTEKLIEAVTKLHCPSDFGLEDSTKCLGRSQSDSCEKCWEKALGKEYKNKYQV